MAPGNYFIEVVEVDGSNNDSCVGATENELLIELDPLSGTPVVLQDISCNAPGLIEVQNPLGGGGIYTYTVTGPVPFVTITTTSDNPIEIPANSPAGTYAVEIQDQFGCSMPLGTVDLDLTPNPTITGIAVDNCTDPATVTITATTTAAQIFYSLDGGTTYVDNGGVFNNIAAGTYNVSIIDSNGCIDTDTVTVHPVLQANVALTKLLDCSISPDAEITLEVLQGSGSYDYEISDGSGIVVSRTGLSTNPLVFSTTTVEDYIITIYDNNTASPECSRVFNVSVPPAIMPSFSITSFSDVTCNGDADGTISVSAVDNGTGPYTFEIISGPGSSASFPIAPTSSNATTATFTGLEGSISGITYTIEVTAANGCTTTLTQIISQPDPIANINTSVVEFGCTTGNNMNNATITVDTASITGGSGTYVIYEFINDQGTPATGDDVVVQSGSNNVYIETNTAGGSYIINVYDNNGCVGTATENIAPFDELLSASVAIDAVATCVTGENITITATGSITNSITDPANYEFRLLPSGVFQASGSFTGLAVGIHNFEVRNTVTGCIISVSHTVASPEVLDLDVVSTTNITCFGGTDGEVELNLVDASSITYASATSYTLYYDINNTPTNLADDVITTGSDADGSFTITGLAAGTYYIEVTDTNPPGAACVYTQSFNIAGPAAAITAATAITDITCNPGNDGIIEITNAQGGWGGYLYYVSTVANPDPNDPSNYVANPRFENLVAGTYEIWVIDQFGCAVQLPDETLADPLPIVADLQVNNENCVNLQGEIEVVGIPATNPITGGQGSNYMYQLIRNGGNVGSPQTSTIFSGLGAGSYEVYIIDQWGCDTTVGPVVLSEAMSATATVVKPIDCTVDPGGQITINVSGGSSNLFFEVVFPDGLTTDNNTTGVFTGLTQPGTYTFTVTDSDTTTPCTFTLTQELDDKVDPSLLASTIQNVSCFGGSDGSILANLDPATAANPIYRYELIGISVGAPSRPLQDTPLFENLPAGDYEVRVVSSRGCEDTRPETITEPTALTASATASAFVCSPSNSVNESTVTVTANGGTGTYYYSFNGNGFTQDATFGVTDNGSVQTINYIVRDVNGCEYVDSVDVQPLNTFSLNTAQDIAITCNNPERVTITVVESIGGDSYTFALLPVGNPYGSVVSSTSTTATFDLSIPGNYTFRATNDTTGCYEEITYTIAPYDTIDVVASVVSHAMCYGEAGTLEIDVTGYTGAYDYEVFRADGSSLGLTGSGNTSVNPFEIPDPTNLLVGGSYYIRVTETGAPFCVEDSNTVQIISPSAALDAAPVEVANVTCTNDQGQIYVAPTGGTAPYNIVLTNTDTSQVYNANNVASFLFTGLSAGDFDVEITDANGCPLTRTITLVRPDDITASISASTTMLDCYGQDDASITAINVLGGQGVYQYQLNVYDATGTNIVFTSGVQSSATFTGLGAGYYGITISDDWNCGVDVGPIQIQEPDEVESNLVQTAEMTCTMDGSMRLSASGGSGSYEYYDVNTSTWQSFNNGSYHDFPNMLADAYQFMVRDSNGCTAMVSNQVTIDEVPELILTIDDSAAFINCFGEPTGTIIAHATGGLGNYNYELFSDAALTNLVAGPNTNGVFNGLYAGDYYVRVTSEDCVEVSPVIPIVDPAPLQVDREESTDATCSGMNDGTITVEVSGGTGQILYAISPNLDQFDTVNTFTDLAPGTYDVIAQDINGCFMTFQFTIEQPEPIEAEAINIMHEVCFDSADGSFELQITGGTAPYETALDSNADADFVPGQTVFQNLSAGTHVVFIRDAEGCDTNVFVEIEPGVNLGATVTPMYECTGNIPSNSLDIIFEDPTVSADVLYALDSTDPADMQLSADFTNMTPGDHYITIAHANGCMTTYDFTIEGYEPLTLILENNTINQITAVAEGGVAPYTFYFDDVDNGSENTFYINRTDTYTVTVIDQNGCQATAEIFMEFIDIEMPNFFTPDGDGLNDTWIPDNIEGFPDVLIKIYDRYGRVVEEMTRNTQGWDGNYDGKPLPTGDYWYVVRLQGEQDNREFVGHFTLYRQ